MVKLLFPPQVFDVQRKITYKNLSNWYKELREYRPEIPCCVVANKIDGEFFCDTCIHPCLGHRDQLEPIPALFGQKGSPWTGCQSVTGPHVDEQPSTLTLIPTGNLEAALKVTCMSLDYGRKPEYPEKTHTSTGRTRKLHKEKPLLEVCTRNAAARRQR